MPSGVRSDSRLADRNSRLAARYWIRWTGDLPAFAVVAPAAVAARLPFLLRANRFFDADEAVEGLMARHVLFGEHQLLSRSGASPHRARPILAQLQDHVPHGERIIVSPTDGIDRYPPYIRIVALNESIDAFDCR